jgi:hypothetical protein
LKLAARRFRAPALPDSLEEARARGTATALATAIERARQALAAGSAPGDEIRALFLDALARHIAEAMRPAHGDAAFQAMVLRHRSPAVREFASLNAHAERDRRQIRSGVNALAHPEKLQRQPPGPIRDTLQRAQEASTAGDWSSVAEPILDLMGLPEVQDDPVLCRSLERVVFDDAFTRLRRIDALSKLAEVERYRALWARRGPAAGTELAASTGTGAQRRGDAVEALAAAALQALADRLNAQAEAARDASRYRIATSLRVPSSLGGDAHGAKSEWDAALLRRHEADQAWDLCLIVEAKASPDAATTDLPRLLRGLRVLARADIDTDYPFAARGGEVWLRGASLAALPTEEAGLARAVIYCSDGDVERAPRPLNAASRMQLLSAEASLAAAARLEDGAAPDPSALTPVWRQLLESPAFSPVLRQYPTLRAVRELMLHPHDLMAAVQAEPGAT